MTSRELEVWLGGRDGARLPTTTEVAMLLGVLPAAGAAGSQSRRALTIRLAAARVCVAVLRDVFPDDDGLRRWLCRSRPELDDHSALDLLRTGHAQVVERLAVHEWNHPTHAPSAVR